MLSALRAYFENISTWLVLVKYLGLGLAAGSSIWATLNVLTVTTPGGHRKLTAAGYVAIGFTVLGLVISIVSDDLQRRSAAASQRAQIEAESKRTNEIIIAGQRITSLNVTWKIRGLDDELSKKVKQTGDEASVFISEQQGHRSAEQNSYVYRIYQLYPFLADFSHRFVKPGKNADQNRNALVLIALDDDYGAVLPFGFLLSDDIRRPLANDKKAPLPETIEIATDDEDSHPKILNWPHLSLDGGKDVVLQWRLDPATFANAIQRQNQFIVPMAKLPNTLRLAVLFDIGDLPFAAGNLSLPRDQNFWNYPDYKDHKNTEFRGRVDYVTKSFSSSIQLVPNSSSFVSYNYDLKQVYETLFRDSYGEADRRIRCIVFQFSRVIQQP